MKRLSWEERKKQARHEATVAKAAAMEPDVKEGTPGDPSRHFGSLDDEAFADSIKKEPTILLARVSTNKQARNGDLDDQVVNLKKVAKRRKLNVVGVFRHVGKANDPGWMKRVARSAQQRKATVILAESVDRFVRHKDAHVNRTNYWWKPTEEHFKRLKETVGTLKLVTVASLDATNEEVRSYQTKRGQSEKNNKGGRPRTRQAGYRKQVKADYLNVVYTMRDDGCSLRSIALHVSGLAGFPVSPTCIFKWLRNRETAASSCSLVA